MATNYALSARQERQNQRRLVLVVFVNSIFFAVILGTGYFLKLRLDEARRAEHELTLKRIYDLLPNPTPLAPPDASLGKPEDKPTNSTGSDLATQVADLHAQIQSLRASNDQLQALLGDDPVKKMGFVLLARDMASLQNKTERELTLLREEQRLETQNLRTEVKGNFDLLLWVILIAGAVNIASPIIGKRLSKGGGSKDD